MFTDTALFLGLSSYLIVFLLGQQTADSPILTTTVINRIFDYSELIKTDKSRYIRWYKYIYFEISMPDLSRNYLSNL